MRKNAHATHPSEQSPLRLHSSASAPHSSAATQAHLSLIFTLTLLLHKLIALSKDEAADAHAADARRVRPGTSVDGIRQRGCVD